MWRLSAERSGLVWGKIRERILLETGLVHRTENNANQVNNGSIFR